MSLVDILMALLTVMLTIVNGWLVFVLQGLKKDLDNLQANHNNLVQKQAAHEVLMARTVITRDDFRLDMEAQTRNLKQFIGSNFNRREGSDD